MQGQIAGKSGKSKGGMGRSTPTAVSARPGAGHLAGAFSAGLAFTEGQQGGRTLQLCLIFRPTCPGGQRDFEIYTLLVYRLGASGS